MEKRTLFLLGTLLIGGAMMAQERYGTRTGQVTFFSGTPMENIEAVNHKVNAVMDLTSGQVQVNMLIKGFEFEKALMQEHFNENYMESNTYPKAEFKGAIAGVKAEELKKAGKHEVSLEGDLTVHGVTQKRTLTGTITTDAAGAMAAETSFVVKPADHGIKIPGGVNVADEIKVTAKIPFTKM